MLFVPRRPGTNPVWSGFIRFLIHFCILLFSIDVKILKSLHSKLIGRYEPHCVGSFPSLYMTEPIASHQLPGGSFSCKA